MDTVISSVSGSAVPVIVKVLSGSQLVMTSGWSIVGWSRGQSISRVTSSDVTVSCPSPSPWVAVAIIWNVPSPISLVFTVIDHEPSSPISVVLPISSPSTMDTVISSVSGSAVPVIVKVRSGSQLVMTSGWSIVGWSRGQSISRVTSSDVGLRFLLLLLHPGLR